MLRFPLIVYSLIFDSIKDESLQKIKKKLICFVFFVKPAPHTLSGKTNVLYSEIYSVFKRLNNSYKLNLGCEF